jgi:hypothetical protein
MLQDGDSIHFNIPGPGPVYLVTPPQNPSNGYPAIVHNNVTIDGYTQPGAYPNTNPILASNNARIQIVLDSRAGGRHVENIPGLSLHESEVLLVKGATNVTIRGLCFLGPGIVINPSPSDPLTYAISFELGASYGHVNGCWFGVDPDRQSVYRLDAGVTGFEGPSGQYIDGTVIGVEKTAPDALTARGQFNVLVGEYIPLIFEGAGHRICGNFLNVFPDGLSDYPSDASGPDPYWLQAFIEIGRRGDNLVLGTDGDGHNDADERNIFGGVTVADDGQLLEWYGGSQTNMVIAGNYIGVGVDGMTRFTNSMQVFNHFNSSATVRIGSDFDGVSDDVERNVISMNYPFAALFPDPSKSTPFRFADLDTGAQVSLRGNQLIGNNIPPFSFADGTGHYLQAFTNSCARFMDTNDVIPVLATNCTQARLLGTCALPVPPYTNIIIDLYLADPEGWTNGQKFQFSELAYTDPVTFETAYDGFAQGKTYLGSFIKNGPLDASPGSNSFNFDITALNLAPGAWVTATANYSIDPPGTHNGRTQTSNFSRPMTLQAVPLLGITLSGTNLVLSWPVAAGVFNVQESSTVAPCKWNDLHPQPPLTQNGSQYQATVPMHATLQFYRLRR